MIGDGMKANILSGSAEAKSGHEQRRRLWAANLVHPGGNIAGISITGIFLDLPGFNAKSLQLLREAVPTLTKVRCSGIH
jgi:hypothetical protein